MHFLVMLLVTVFSLNSFATDFRHQCGENRIEHTSYKWCVDAPDLRERSDTVLYYMHGAQGSEQDWQLVPEFADIRENWIARKVKQPTVISISFGPEWLLTTIKDNSHPALLPLFFKKVMPEIERKFSIQNPKRMVFGGSMGGYNSSILFLKSPVSFDKVALVCPGISILGPYTPAKEISKFLRLNPFVRKDFIDNLLNWARAEFPTKADWASHDALNLINLMRVRKSNTPRLYVSCGQRDEYGFYPAALMFAQKAKRKVNTLWKPLEGGHCVMDAKSIAEFLIPSSN